MADYCTIAEVKNMMPDVEWASDYDATILSLISRASRAIDRWTGREPDAYCAQETTRVFDIVRGIGNAIENGYAVTRLFALKFDTKKD